MTSFSRLSLALAFLACLTLASSAAAEVYKWVDENGAVHYTDRPPEAGLESTEIDVPAIPEAQTRATEAADPQSATPWYEQWLTEQRELRLAEQQAREAASAKKGGEQSQLLEECIQARRRLTILETPCRVFF